MKKNYLMTFVSTLLSTFLLLVCVQVQAATYTSVTTIGDSQFDGGNEATTVMSAFRLFGAASLPQAQGYFHYKYTNGYTSAEYLAYYMGMYDKTKFFNYAIGGSSSENLPGILTFIYTQKPIDPTGLYVIWTGHHDVFRSTISRDQTAENIKLAVVDLYNHGVRNFMVINLPPMEQSPAYNKQSTIELESVKTAYKTINTVLATKLNQLTFKNRIVQMNAAGFFNQIPTRAASVGFTNTLDRCYDGRNQTTCNSPDTYIWWDDLHLSDKTNQYLGAYMKSYLDQNAPPN